MTQAPARDAKVDSTFLDPSFTAELQAAAKQYDANQELSDDNKWTIARLVNEMWPEHKTLTYDGFTGEKVYETKEDFYVACSFAANEGLKKKRFSASGETLRRWCEVQATYSPFKEADLLLSELSFEHLRIAKSLAYREKVKTPIHALRYAIENGATADELKEHFDPSSKNVHPFDKVVGWLAGLASIKWDWIKSKDDRDEAKRLTAQLSAIVERNK